MVLILIYSSTLDGVNVLAIDYLTKLLSKKSLLNNWEESYFSPIINSFSFKKG